MEENLGEVNIMIDNLRNMAIDMGQEVDNQNTMLNRMNAKVSVFMSVLNQRFDKLID